MKRLDITNLPSIDQRRYRHLTLTNELQVVLISDEEAELAAAAMDVGVGHSSDPHEQPGLAHFLEHMLFLGTDKYPEVGEYQQFVSEHGGSCNAFTGFENTNFHFEVAHEHLAAALDRFAQFFICPRFTESAAERELHAVDSEHRTNAQSDEWRLMQLLKHCAAPEHAFHKFGTGTLATLRDAEGGASGSGGGGTRAKLLAFHAAHYAARSMRLVVLGRESLEELEELVAPLFAAVPAKPHGATTGLAATVAAPPVEPYGRAQLQRVVRAVPVGERRTLTLVWPLPPLRPLWRSKPHRLLGHLLGHEAGGSLLALLRARGWAHALSAGEGNHAYSDFGLFEVRIELTEAGDAHAAEDIPRLVFQYIALLRTAPPEQLEPLAAECAALGALAFRFRESHPPSEEASGLAHALAWYPPEALLSGPYLSDEWRAEPFAELAASLSPERVLLFHVSKRHAATASSGAELQAEPWYGTQYAVAAVPEETAQAWRAAPPHEQLHLPSPNPFVPTDLALVDDADAADVTATPVDAAPAVAKPAVAAPKAVAPAYPPEVTAPVVKLRGLGGDNVRHADAGGSGTVDAFEYATFGAPAALARRGVVYWEVTVLAAAAKKGNDVQAGFASAAFRTLSDGAGHSPDGVGDDGDSWAVDGVRKLKWHAGQARWACKPWGAGDVIGLAANVSLGKIAVARNGDWGERGCGVVFSDKRLRDGVYPAFSLQQLPLMYALAPTEWKHAPPPAAVWEETKPKSKSAKAKDRPPKHEVDAAVDVSVEPLAPSSATAPPVAVVDDTALTLWHKLDRTYRRPMAHARLEIISPAAYHTPAAAVLTHVFGRLVSDELGELAYSAHVAGLDCLIANTASGLSVRVEGYSHRLPRLLVAVARALRCAELSPERFAAHLELARCGYANFFASDEPLRHATYAATHLLEMHRWHVAEYLAVVEDAAACSHEALCALARPGGPLLARAFVRALWCGNTSADDAVVAAREAVAALGCAPLGASQRAAPRALELRAGVPVVVRTHVSLLEAAARRHASADEANSAVEVYLQVGRDQRRRTALLELLAQVLEAPLYLRLRTEEQLGYHVGSGVRFDCGVVGLRVLVQSAEHDAAHLDSRVEAFLATVARLLEKLPAAEFGRHRAALVAQKRARDTSLAAESARHWAQIDIGTLDFGRGARDAAVLAALTLGELRTFWADYCAPGAPHRRRLSSQVFAPRHALPPPPPPPARCLDGLEAVLAFKRELSAFPPPSPLAEGVGRAGAVECD